MQFIKCFNQNIYRSTVQLLPLLISCSLLVCCAKENSKHFLPTENQIRITESAVNINTATVQELEKLPSVGAKIAERIVEHRERFGRFRRAEHLLLIDGISDERFREIRNFVKVE